MVLLSSQKIVRFSMIKKFSYAFLILAHGGNINGVDWDAFYKVLANVTDRKPAFFERLTDREWDIYRTQVNQPDTPERWGSLPIELAAKEGNALLVRWLAENGSRISDTCALECALSPRSNKHYNSEVVEILLRWGAIVTGICGETPLEYMQKRLSRVDSYDGSMTAKPNIKRIIILLQNHAGWSPWRAAWCGAAVRGCQERARVAAHKSAKPVGINLLGIPDIGKPSVCESELK